MPVVSDFTVIQGDGRITIGDSGTTLWEATFGTGGRAANEIAFLIFNVRGLTDATTDVAVKVNNVEVGTIRRYASGNNNAGDWYTQMITVDGSTLNSGNNELQIEAVGWPGATAGNMFDDFDLKDVICFFHQEV
jgi:hypothetical protein